MSRIYTFVLGLLLVVVASGALISRYLHNHPAALLHPQGVVATQQFNLIIFATLLSLLVVIPVFILTIYIAWNYRASNTKATYMPAWDHNPRLEFIWWAIPSVIIILLAAITWKSSHDLDPFKPLASTTKPITIQVVALPWKWLFIYPEQQIATVNYVNFPEQTPVNFQITADAPMNSFWIPQLGGQIYAMAGMSTELHLMADGIGSYRGSSANLSGQGFSGMNFRAQAISNADFDSWVTSVKQSSLPLNYENYHQLAKPSENNVLARYGIVEPGLYHRIIMSYMAQENTPVKGQMDHEMSDMPDMPGMSHHHATSGSGY